jgi:purine-binding chemotaxis protein CheW
MQNNEIQQELASRLSALSEEQAEAVREYLQGLSPLDEEETDANTKYLTFQCGGQMFGIGIRQVIQIIRVPSITPLPESSSYMKGVIDVRDEMIPVIDLRMKLGKDGTVDSSKNCIVIVTIQGRSVGMIVDSINNVETIMPEEICQPPHQDTHGADYLIGIVKKDTVILLVDADLLLTACDLNEVLDLAGELSQE